MTTINVCSKVDFADIVDPQYSGVPSVGRVVGSAVVQGAPCRERKPRLQLVFIDQLPGRGFQRLTAQREAVSGIIYGYTILFTCFIYIFILKSTFIYPPPCFIIDV